MFKKRVFTIELKTPNSSQTLLHQRSSHTPETLKDRDCFECFLCRLLCFIFFSPLEEEDLIRESSHQMRIVSLEGATWFLCFVPFFPQFGFWFRKFYLLINGRSIMDDGGRGPAVGNSWHPVYTQTEKNKHILSSGQRLMRIRVQRLKVCGFPNGRESFKDWQSCFSCEVLALVHELGAKEVRCLRPNED